MRIRIGWAVYKMQMKASRKGRNLDISPSSVFYGADFLPVFGQNAADTLSFGSERIFPDPARISPGAFLGGNSNLSRRNDQIFERKN